MASAIAIGVNAKAENTTSSESVVPKWREYMSQGKLTAPPSSIMASVRRRSPNASATIPQSGGSTTLTSGVTAASVPSWASEKPWRLKNRNR